MIPASNSPLAPLLERLSQSEASYDVTRLQKAYDAALAVYADELHWTGVTVLEHALGLLEILSPFEPDEDTVIACLLHHVLELQVMTLAEVEEHFGPKVRSLISGIHLLAHVTLEGRRRSIEDLRVMLLSVSDDVRILFVALCDCQNCLQHVDTSPSSKRRQLCQDVVHLFAPVAARLGMYTLKHSLESAAFPVLYPNDSEHIGEQLTRISHEQPNVLGKATVLLQDFLKNHDIQARIEGRQKQPFSIFQKMHKKSLSDIERIYDLYALRVIVDSEEDCYRVLGLLHRIGRPLPNRFKDYISFPKPNGYQSLHTTLGGLSDLPDDCFVEIQIRTEKMDREARFGIAAHWSYKEHGATERALENAQLHSMLVTQQAVDTTENEPAFADHIFVLTPRGDIIELPEGATPLDFAFQVHSDLGLAFRSARVNGSIVPIDYQLENGDVVEVSKYSTPQPSAQWIHVLKMGSSRSKLRRYLYAQDRPQLITLGKELLNAELQKRKLPPLTTELALLKVCDGKQQTLHQREDLLMKLGQGAEKVSTLLQRLDAVDHAEAAIEKSQPKKQPKAAEKTVMIEGGLSMPVRFAKCCNCDKSPTGKIVGNISRSGKVMVHKAHCKMFANTNPERRVKIWWA